MPEIVILRIQKTDNPSDIENAEDYKILLHSLPRQGETIELQCDKGIMEVKVTHVIHRWHLIKGPKDSLQNDMMEDKIIVLGRLQSREENITLTPVKET